MTEHGCFVTDAPYCTCGWVGRRLTLTENLDEAAEHARITDGRMLDDDEIDFGLIADAVCEICLRPCEGVRCVRDEVA